MRSLPRLTCHVLLCLLLAACARERVPAESSAAAPGEAATATAFTPEGERAAAQITGDYIRSVVAELADDRYEGRGTGTPGDRRAREWLAGELRRLGYEPGGPGGSWEQTFELVGLDTQLPARWEFARDGRRATLRRREDFIAVTGVQAERASLDDAELVFVGYGIEAPEFGWDDFKGEDLRGKVLLVLNNDPDWDPQLFAGETRLYYGRWMYKYESAARRGAAGAIIVHTTPSAGYPWQVVQTSWSGEQFEVPASGEPTVAVKSWVTEGAAREIVALAGRSLDELVAAARSRDFRPVHLGIRTSLDVTTKVERTSTANVLGLLRGSDPRLAQQAVILSAHHDHLGVGEPDAEGDRIYNGAEDNASGMAQVLAIAKAVAALPEPPRRSVLVLFPGAEEQGLLGSLYYAQHPTFPPGRIAANINYDGGNIFGRARDLVFVGKGKSTLDDVVAAVAQRQGRVVVGDRYPDRGYFYRSDQFNFAKIGVPAFYIYRSVDFFGHDEAWGRARQDEYEEKRYHQPGDELTAAWNFDGLVDNARAGFWVALIVADADEMPAWRPGDEFEAARRQALADAGP